nr:hypothetical protein [Prevotella sp.]
MNTFNLNRFGHLLRYTILYNKSKLVNTTIGYFIFFSIVYLLSTGLLFSPDYLDRMDTAAGITVGTFLGFIIFIPSWILANMRNKQSTIDYLMLPASALEKYLARMLFVTVMLIVCFAIAVICADVFQWLVSLTKYPISQTSFVIGRIFEEEEKFINISGMGPIDVRLVAANIYINFILLHSIYTLGGTLFRKRAWVFSSLLMIILVFIFMYVVSGLDGEEISSWVTNNINALLIILTCLAAIFASLNYYLSFRIFKNIQVINNKWINI